MSYDGATPCPRRDVASTMDISGVPLDFGTQWR